MKNKLSLISVMLLTSTISFSAMALESAVLNIATTITEKPCDISFDEPTLVLGTISREILTDTGANVVDANSGYRTLSVACGYDRKVSVTVTDNLTNDLNSDVSSANSGVNKFRFDSFGAGYIISLDQAQVTTKDGGSPEKTKIATDIGNPGNATDSVAALTTTPFTWVKDNLVKAGSKYTTRFKVTPVLPKLSNLPSTGANIDLNGSITATVAYL